MTLSELKPGKQALVKQIDNLPENEGLVNRLEAIGITPNKPIMVLRQAWFGGPLHVRVGYTTEIAIRHQEAKIIILQDMEA
ncbi:MAG TPA: FeoA family protein [Allocoleopsis sp.]